MIHFYCERNGTLLISKVKLVFSVWNVIKKEKRKKKIILVVHMNSTLSFVVYGFSRKTFIFKEKAIFLVCFAFSFIIIIRIYLYSHMNTTLTHNHHCLR